MQLSELRDDHFQKKYLFDPHGYERIYVFVDFANVRQWAKNFWPTDRKDIDIHKLSQVINSIYPAAKFFYYGHYKHEGFLPENDPFNVKHRQSTARLNKAVESGFTVRTKEIKMIFDYDENGIRDGQFYKCNFDIEMAMDMLNHIDDYDTAFVWSGDSDFKQLLEYLKSKRKKVITICSKGVASEEIREVSDLFIQADRLKEHLSYGTRNISIQKPVS